MKLAHETSQQSYEIGSITITILKVRVLERQRGVITCLGSSDPLAPEPACVFTGPGLTCKWIQKYPVEGRHPNSVVLATPSQSQ